MSCRRQAVKKQLKDKLRRRRNFGRLCVFERMPGIFRVNGTGLARTDGAGRVAP